MSVLSSIDLNFEWEEGVKMPVADEENKILEDKLTGKKKAVHSAEVELAEYETRIGVLSHHLKSVRQELQSTQELLIARKKELETETHLDKVAEHEIGRLKRDIRKMEDQLQQLRDKRKKHENGISRQKMKLENLRTRMNWDQQALEAWLEECQRRDDDALTFEKYARQDEIKIKELSFNIERLTEDLNKKKKAFDQETTETMTAQIELDKTVEEFRRLHEERQMLIHKWEQSITQMQKRDQEIEQLAEKLASLKTELYNKQQEMKDRQSFLDSEISNNKELENKIALTERALSKSRLRYQEIEKHYLLIADELDTLKNTVDKTATELENMRSHITQLKRGIQEKTNRLQQTQEICKSLREKLKMIVESTLSAEERGAQLDAMLKQEEVVQRHLDSDMGLMREVHYKRTQELYAARQQEKLLISDIQGCRAGKRNLDSNILMLDKELEKQQEMHYSQDFVLQRIERKISVLEGQSSNEDKDRLEKRIQELNRIYGEKEELFQYYNSQLKRLQDDVRRLKKAVERIKAEKEFYSKDIEELNLYNDSSAKELKKTVARKQELMVEANLVKLELKRLQEILYSKSDEVFTLEKRKLQLETGMKQRQVKINMHKGMLKAELKTAEEEKNRIYLELHEKLAKVDKLKNRYEILMMSMPMPEGEEERSEIYYLIKAAQDREELQKEGDKLDVNIQKAEQELQAMENTITLMNNSINRSQKVTITGEKYEKRIQLEEEFNTINEKLKYKKRRIRELQEDLQAIKQQWENVKEDETAHEDAVDDQKSKIEQLKKEIEDQKIKIARANKQNEKLLSQLKNKTGDDQTTRTEKDIELRDLRDFNRNIIKQVSDIMRQYPEITDTVQNHFKESNIPLSPVPSLVSSKIGSFASLTSSKYNVSTKTSQTSLVPTGMKISQGSNIVSSHVIQLDLHNGF